MAVKLRLANKAEYDALPEARRADYVEREGFYVLDVDTAMVPESDFKAKANKLEEFRTNNVKLLKDVDDFNKRLAAFDGVDPEEYRALKADSDKLKKKGVDKADDMEAYVKRAVDAALKPVNEKLAAEEKARIEAQSRADAAKFRELASAEAVKAGVKPNALRHVLRDAESVYELRGDALAPRDGHDAAMSDWLGSIAKSDPYLFESSNGGGAHHSGNGQKSTARQLVNPTSEEMGRNMDAIAKGDMVVVRQ